MSQSGNLKESKCGIQPEGPHLCLVLAPDRVPNFFRLLQRGVMLKTRFGTTIHHFLTKELALSPEYVDERIQTIFLDGKAVDDFDSAQVGQGSTLSLSAAMPGLAGATLRRGGRYASMRKQISHQGERVSGADGEGWMVLKLFNLLVRELGAPLLEKGVWVRGNDLWTFLEEQSRDLLKGCLKATVNGREISATEIPESIRENKQVFLQVLSEELAARDGRKDT